MKKAIMSVIMLTLTGMIFTSCGGGDEKENESISYTESEIVDILAGTWEVYGHVNGYIRFYEPESEMKIETDYIGTIEFTKNQRCKAKSSTIYEMTLGGKTIKITLAQFFGGTSYSAYSALRKNGKMYIAVGTTPTINFEIVSLSKKAFKLVRNESDDFLYKDTFDGVTFTNKITCDCYITINSN